MYKAHFAESYFPAQGEDVVLDTTVASILRERAALSSNAEALVECDMEGILRHRWTFGRLSRHSLKLRCPFRRLSLRPSRVSVHAASVTPGRER